MTSDQVWIGISLTLALAVGCQIVGSKLRIPALLLLLPAGFIAGAVTDDVNPNNLLGASFQPLVSLAVAVILYDAGLGLNLSKLTGHTRRVVVRLLLLGVPLTWVVATLVSGPLFDMAHGAAVMFGAILVVSGPTVVGPLLGFIRGDRDPATHLGTHLQLGGDRDPARRGGWPRLPDRVARGRPTGALERDGDTILFHPDLTDDAMIREFGGGARFAVAAGDNVPPDHKLLFRVRRNGELVAVTTRSTPRPQAGDSVVLFGPISTIPQALTTSPDAGSA